MADESYFLRREGWKILEMRGCPKGFPLEVEVTFLVGKGKLGKYRVAWIDQSGALQILDNFSLKDGRLEATITVGNQKWVLSGVPIRTTSGKPGLAGNVAVKKGTASKGVKVGYEGSGTWHAEGNGGGGGIVGLAEIKQVVEAAGTKLKKVVRG